MRKLKDYDENYWSNQTPLGLGAKLAAAIVALIVVVGILSFVLGWWNAAKDVVSPTNVKNQYEFAYSYNESLKGVAQNVCNYQQAYNAETDPSAKTQRLTQLLAEKSLYQQREREYDAQLENAFKAKYVKPSDVPTRAPTLSEEITTVC